MSTHRPAPARLRVSLPQTVEYDIRTLAELFPGHYQALERLGPGFPCCFDVDGGFIAPPAEADLNVEFARGLHLNEYLFAEPRLRVRAEDQPEYARLAHWSLPLIVASQFENPEAVRDLVARGARVDAFDRHGNRALLVALAQGRPRTVRMLLDHGANPNRLPGDERSPLAQVLHRHRQELAGQGASAKDVTASLMQMLLDEGALLAPPNETPITLLDVWNSPALVALLLRHGADADVATPIEKDEQGRLSGGLTVLHLAAGIWLSHEEQWVTDEDLEVARLMLEAGARWDLLDANGRTPEMLALKNGQRFVALLNAHRASLTLTESLPTAAATSQRQRL